MTRVSLIPDFNFQRHCSAVAASAPTIVAEDVKVNTKPNEEEIIRILRTCQAVCFDVDSTVIPEEGIDELAAFKGVGEAVADLTRKYVQVFVRIYKATLISFFPVLLHSTGQWVDRCYFKTHWQHDSTSSSRPKQTSALISSNGRSSRWGLLRPKRRID